MSDIILYGAAPSTYTRTARMYLEEKGLSYEFKPPQETVHPFKKIPSMKHGDFILYETTAMGVYIDESFEGTKLQPSEAKAKAEMFQWMSCIIDYMYEPMVKNYVIPYVFPKGEDGKPDRSVIDPSIPLIEERLGILEKGLDGRAYLTGDQVSLADFLLIPITTYLSNFPESAGFMEKLPNVKGHLQRMQARDSFKKTDPQAG